ncbi:MAG TPA: carbohydrate kinase family protein [Nitrospira sp.]|nr:carbohydrate kinase family protein [Nitrospira sp.]
MIDLCSFGFISHLRIMQVDRYPRPNSGSLVFNSFETVSADAPIVALLAAHLGLSASLICNDVGSDPMGLQLRQILKRFAIDTCLTIREGDPTPMTIGVCDQNENRTWFAYLPEVVDSLSRADLTMMRSARLIYVDCYALLDPVLPRALSTAAETRAPVFANLGGDSQSDQVLELLRQTDLFIIQTALDSSFDADPEQFTTGLRDRLHAELTIVTLGRRGAIFATQKGVVHVPAFNVTTLHSNGSGAAFSAGLAYSVLQNWGFEKCVRFASALGALYGSVYDGFGKFDDGVVLDFMENGMLVSERKEQ